jgi:hypothetical protein
MKTTTRSNFYLAMLVIIFTVVLAIPAAAGQQVPFKGTFQGNDCVLLQNTCSVDNSPAINTSGTGIGTHMGVFSLIQETSLITLNGTAHWVAANGDSIDSTFVSVPDFSTQSLGYITVTETHIISGGTGRFTGAQGSFILERTHLVDLSADGTHVTFGSFNGTITSPGAAHAEADED